MAFWKPLSRADPVVTPLLRPIAPILVRPSESRCSVIARAAATESTATWSTPLGMERSPRNTVGAPSRDGLMSPASRDSGEKITPSIIRDWTPSRTFRSAR